MGVGSQKCKHFYQTSFFLLDILFIYISNVIPFPGFHFRKPLSYSPLPCFLRVLPHHPPPPITPPQHPPMLGHQTSTGPRASPPIDVRQGHPLLHMYLELWIPLCTLLLFSSSYKLVPFLKTESHLTSCFYQIDLWTYLWDIFLINDRCGRSDSALRVPPQSRLFWFVQKM